MSLGIQPAEGHVALQLLEQEERKTASGLILAVEQNPIVSAVVVSVHPKEEWLKEGDVVYLRKAQMHDFALEFGQVKIALQSAIVAKVVNTEE